MPFHHEKPIRTCHEFEYYLEKNNTHFLVFNAAKHCHSVIAMQRQLEMSANYSDSGPKNKLYKDSKVQKKENTLLMVQMMCSQYVGWLSSQLLKTTTIYLTG